MTAILTGPRPAPARTRVLVAGLAVVVGALLGAGCTTVRSTIDLLRALRTAGYTSPTARVSTANGFTTVIIKASSGPGDDPDLRAAQIVWRTFKVRFDEVDIDVGGRRQAFTRGELLERFGPRPAGFDQDLTRDVLRGVAVIGVIGLALAAAVVVVIVLVVRANRRKRPPSPPPGWYGGPGPQWPAP